MERGSVAEAWADEAECLMPVGRPFDGFVEYSKRASPTCLVHLERNRYSVPASFANRPVSLRVYTDRFLVVAEGQVVCEHQRIAGPNGHAGPLVVQGGVALSIREWLCDALTPMGHRDPRRLALATRVREELEQEGRLPGDPLDAEREITTEVRLRVRNSGKTNVSRAVSDLVRAGMLQRHYQSYRVDHHNRGAKRRLCTR